MRRLIVLGIAAASLLSLTSITGAQNQPLAFEVASVRSNKSRAQPMSRFPLGPGDAYVPGNLFHGEF
jgi:hypothetical protein